VLGAYQAGGSSGATRSRGVVGLLGLWARWGYWFVPGPRLAWREAGQARGGAGRGGGRARWWQGEVAVRWQDRAGEARGEAGEAVRQAASGRAAWGVSDGSAQALGNNCRPLKEGWHPSQPWLPRPPDCERRG